MKLQLVSFKTCPFVQRALLVLRFKSIPHETTYIDLANKPDWFLKISPRGKVPVLVADGVPLFESQPICEFLEETHPEPPLFSRSPLERARDRAWFTFTAEDLYLPLYTLTTAQARPAFDEAVAKIDERLSRVAEELGGRPWLSCGGARFGMAEVAFAPAFTRLALLERLGAYRIPEKLRAVREWMGRALSIPAVVDSVPADFEAALRASMEKKGALALSINP